MSIAVVENVRNRVRASSNQALAAYWQLALASARNEELDPDRVIETLSDAGKSLEDFESDTVAAEKRIRLRAKADTEPAIVAELEALTEELNAAERGFAEAKKVYLAERNRLLPLIADAKIKLSHARNAERGLRDSCADPSILDAEQDLANQRRNAVGKLRTQREIHARHEANVAKLEAYVAGCQEKVTRHRGSDKVVVDSLERELVNHRGMLSTAEKDLARADAAIADLEAELTAIEHAGNAIRAAKLEP